MNHPHIAQVGASATGDSLLLLSGIGALSTSIADCEGGGQDVLERITSSAICVLSGVCAAIVLREGQTMEIVALTDERGPQFIARLRSAFPIQMDPAVVAAFMADRRN